MHFLFRRILVPILVNALALYIVFYFRSDSGFEISRGVFGFLMVGAVLGLLNTFVRPLLKIVSFPFMIASLGLFLIVINALILVLTEYFFNTLFDQTFGIHFEVGDGVISYLVTAILLSIVNGALHFLVRRKS